MRIVSSGGAVVVGSGGPSQITLTGIADGQELILYGTSDTDSVEFHNGDGLGLYGGVSFILKNRFRLRLIFDATSNIWSELSRADYH